MKSWLRFFGLSFFSDKIAKEAARRGYLNVFLGLLFALIFVFCGVLASNTIPFTTHYKNATEFKAFVHNAFSEITLTVNGGCVSAEDTVNTYLNEAQSEKYALNGYNLVIDTRPSNAYDDFRAYYLANDGSRDEISYEDYHALPEDKKSGYDFKVQYTPDELILSEELIAKCEDYLRSCTDEEISSRYAELSSNKDGVSSENYADSVYNLYIKAYYPEISGYESNGSAPLLRSFYYVNYLYGDNSDYLFVFDDALIGSFETDGGIQTTFYGIFDKMTDGIVSESNADLFLKDAFKATVPMQANVYVMNMFMFIPFFVVIPLIIALIAKIALTLLKVEKYKKFTVCLKVEGSYLAIGSLISAVVLFICGYFVSNALLNALPIVLYAAVLLIRTAVYIVKEYINRKKTDNNKPAEVSA